MNGSVGGCFVAGCILAKRYTHLQLILVGELWENFTMFTTQLRIGTYVTLVKCLYNYFLSTLQVDGGVFSLVRLGPTR